MGRVPIASLCALLFVWLSLAACERGPDADTLRETIAATLDAQFESGLFRIASFQRNGSTPFTDPESGAPRLLVYFRAELEFRRDHDFSAWQGMSVASLAQVMGATEQGISGVTPGGNTAGDILKVHGTSSYHQVDGEWAPLPYKTVAAGAPPPIDELGDPTSGTSLIQKWVALFQRSLDADGPGQARIVEEEVEAALRNIDLRIAGQAGRYTLVTGPVGGEYNRFGAAVAPLIVGPGVRLRHFASQGSVDNVQLVRAGLADLALVQNDIAAFAFRGIGPFEGGAPMSDLRALRALFPEPVQIVTLAGSALQSAADLAGARIDIGLPKSGARFNALLVLDALGLDLAAFAELRETGVSAAIAALKAGEIDAFVTTRAAPSREIQDLAATHPIRLLALDPATIAAVTDLHAYYQRFDIPARTYRGQRETVPTIAVTAIVIAHQSMPDDRVLNLLAAAEANSGRIARADFRGYYLSPKTLTFGLSIPRHPAVEAFIESGGGAAVED